MAIFLVRSSGSSPDRPRNEFLVDAADANAALAAAVAAQRSGYPTPAALLDAHIWAASHGGSQRFDAGFTATLLSDLVDPSKPGLIVGRLIGVNDNTPGN
jgi:hypothetical protein